jgi:hypothetical protein
MKNAPLATHEQILAILNSVAPLAVTITKDETPLENILASLTSFNYEKEDGVTRVEGATFQHVAISKNTGKQYATFKTSDGKFKKLPYPLADSNLIEQSVFTYTTKQAFITHYQF